MNPAAVKFQTLLRTDLVTWFTFSPTVSLKNCSLGLKKVNIQVFHASIFYNSLEFYCLEVIRVYSLQDICFCCNIPNCPKHTWPQWFGPIGNKVAFDQGPGSGVPPYAC